MNRNEKILSVYNFFESIETFKKKISKTSQKRSLKDHFGNIFKVSCMQDKFIAMIQIANS